MRRGGVDLKLSLHVSPPPARGGERASSPDEEEWSSSSLSPSSCLSSEGEHEQHQHQDLQWSDSSGATPMVLAACPRCLMYVMLPEADPRCRSPVLLDFLHHAGVRAAVDGGGDRSSARGGRRA